MTLDQMLNPANKNQANITLSPEQQVVLDTFTGSWCNMAIQAAAGSGKTFMVEQMAKAAQMNYPQARMAYFVFNTSAKENAQNRLSDKVYISTFHGLGLKLINRFVRKASLLPTFGTKTARIFETATRSFIYERVKNGTYGFASTEDSKSMWSVIYKTAALVSFGKTYNVTNAQQLQEVAQKHKLDTSDGLLDNALLVMKDSSYAVRKTANTHIDFDDMMYHAARIDTSTISEDAKFDIIFVDEAQDASEIRKLLAYKVLAENGRIIMVGDIKQAIYGFAGSDSSNFSSVLNSDEFVKVSLPVSRRCSKAVVAYASQYDPSIRAMDNAPEGDVKDVANIDNITTKDAILCRNNAPLFSYYFKLLKAGMPAVIKGKETLPYLVNLIRESKATNNTDLQKFLDNKLIANKASETNKQAGDISLEDAIDCIIMCMEVANKRLNSTGRGGRKIGKPSHFVDLWKGILNQMYVPKGDAVELSTIHRAKGDEWESVYWVGSHLMPSSYATLAWEKEEENVNLFYVLITRAKLNFYKVVHV